MHISSPDDSPELQTHEYRSILNSSIILNNMEFLLFDSFELSMPI